MELIKPKKLKQGDTIGIVSTSSWAEESYREAGVKALRDLGFNVFIHPQCYIRDDGSAGTTQDKINALHDIFLDPTVDVVFALRGGARAIHTLDGIDYDLIKSHPKIFAGFSDVTVLSSAIFAKTGLVGFHTITTNFYSKKEAQESIAATLDLFSDNWDKPLWLETYPIEILKTGEVTGQLFGGNLAMLTALLAAGDQYLPELEGKILVIEDVGEEIRAIDRMLGVFRLRGIFDKIAGLIVGQMTNIVDTSYIPFGKTVKDIVLEHAAKVKGPIILNAPIGHEHPNIPFPIGIRARLTAPENGAPQLQLLESPFAD